MRSRRAKFNRQARRAIGWALGLFVAGQLVAGLTLDYVFPFTRFPSAGQVLDAAAAEPGPPAFVFLGSSRTGAGIDAGEAGKLLADTGRPARVLNAAVPAGDALSAEFVFDRLLAQGSKPAWAIIEVSPEALNFRSPFMKEHAARQLNWEHLPILLDDVLYSQAGWLYLESRMVPLFTHRKQLIRQAKQAVRSRVPLPPPPPRPPPAPAAPAAPTDPADDAKLAAGPLDWDAIIRARANVPPEKLAEQSQAAAQTTVRRWLRKYRPEGAAADALDRLLARCRAEGVGVVLWAVPASTAHRAEYTPDIEAAFRAHLDRQVAEYGYRFVDSRDWVPDDGYFDPMHIGPGAAKVLTARMVREVLVSLPLE